MLEKSHPKPNIIFILPDQQRADFLSCYGANFIRTPHIDRLAERGILFSQAYSPHPLCVPARVSLMTGMNAIKTGVLDNGKFLRPDYAERGIRLWPEILRENGYYTAAIGKMHFYPWDLNLGFQYRVIAEDKRWITIRDDYYHYLKSHGYRKLHGKEYPGYDDNKGAVYSQIPWEHTVDRFVGQETCRFLREYGNEGPFVMMIGFPGPHCPYDPVERFARKFDPQEMPEPIVDHKVNTPRIITANIEGNKQPWNGVDYSEFTIEQRKKIRAHYAGLVSQIDYEVGRILETLAENHLTENTIIIYASDHGDYLGDHAMIGKGSFYQASIHIPLIVHIPWLNESIRTDSLVNLEDITATLLTLSGCEIPAYMDSRPLPLPGIQAQGTRDYLIGMLTGGWTIYDGEWRLAKYATGETVLFHVKEDPRELTNRLNDPGCQKIYHRLDRELNRAIMDSITAANYDCAVYIHDLSQDLSFGCKDWRRMYPRRLDEY